MLKACWNCIAPANVREHDGPYGSVSAHLNGDAQRAPPWPQPRFHNETMFLLPKQLALGDKVQVSGRMNSDPRIFTVNLVTGNSNPDYGNIACQIEARFPDEDRLSLKIVQDGYTEEISGDYQSIPASEWFAGSSFNFGFIISVSRDYGDGHSIEIQIGGSFLEEVKLKHNVGDIRFLTLHGDIEKVEKLDFVFG